MFVQEIRRLYAHGNCFEMVRIAFDVDARVVTAALRWPVTPDDGLQERIDTYLARDRTALLHCLPAGVAPDSLAS